MAVHLACQSIWHGGCDLALAGGVNLILTPEPWAVLSLARIISPDGMARVFDAHANGFVRGEGAGVVVLKPLQKAQADGDSIYAVIRGSASNNDGRNSSVMTPNQEAQEAVLRAAYLHAGIAPGEVQYVEAHGTGTSVGDPIEARALGAVMAEGRKPGVPCIIGSAKTNIGHLEAAAGIAGLIKAALCSAAAGNSPKPPLCDSESRGALGHPPTLRAAGTRSVAPHRWAGACRRQLVWHLRHQRAYRSGRSPARALA